MSSKAGAVGVAVAAALALLAATASARPGPKQLRLTATRQLDPRLRELTFTTPALRSAQRVRVLMPSGYRAGRRYPVLYLLHGSLGDETSWTTQGDAERITAGFPIIVVMPDGGTAGNYTDWFRPGEHGPYDWETYHVGQLLPWIDAHLPTNGRRAIAGLSMGGGGAFHYAATYPDRFMAAASFSGALDTNSPLVQPLTASAGLLAGDPSASVYGDRASEEIRWRGHNPWDLAANLRGLRLTIRTGNGSPGGPGGDLGDPVEAEVHTESVEMHHRLQALGIAHRFDDYGPGGHDWYYWRRDLRRLMPALRRTFAHRRRAPATVTYRSIARAYEIYGWRVTIERPALEFSALRHASTRGFTVSGSGSATVRTPARFRARQRVRVRVGGATRTVRADRHGRLTVRVVLGPGNRFQAFTPAAEAAPGATASAGTRVYTRAVRLRP